MAVVYWPCYGFVCETMLLGDTYFKRFDKLVIIYLFYVQMDFKSKAHFIQHLANVHGLAMRAGSPSPIMKTRAAFCLITTPLTRISRQICKGILDIHRSARRPFQPINIALIKQECKTLSLITVFIFCELFFAILDKNTLQHRKFWKIVD